MSKYYFGFFSAIIIAVIFFGCQKINSNAYNNQVIATPYSMYFGDTSGAMFHTNDGKKFDQLSFPADGLPFRTILYSGTYILFSKTNIGMPVEDNTHLNYSYDNGADFNDGYDSLKSIPGLCVNGMPYDLSQNVVQDVPRWHKLYCCSNVPFATLGSNWLGLYYSYSNGAWGSWTPEVFYGRTNVLPATITSLTFTSGNVLYGLDGINHRTFYRSDTFNTTLFNETTTGVGWAPLPQTGVALPTTGFFSIGHYNNELLAFDQTGTNGVYYSDDSCFDWFQCCGLPTGIPLLCLNSPFEEVCMLGTGAGLYIMNVNTHCFQPSNNGLSPNCIVTGIVGKANYYKNGELQKQIFITTNKGLYVSNDMGENWILSRPGNYTAIY